MSEHAVIIRITREGGKRIRIDADCIDRTTGTKRRNGAPGSMIAMLSGGTIFAEESPEKIDELIMRERCQTALAL